MDDTPMERTRNRRRTTPPLRIVFVVGGVMSGVGKGITTAAIARLLQERGYRVTALKIDPYINVDAGTMNPTEHGEVFVLADGDETDQDMGNYERFLDVDLSRRNYMTTGRVYQSVIARERALAYRGKCVEVVPHIPLEIIDRITTAMRSSDADVAVVEIGGTVGEYQNILFLEAVRMLRHRRDVRTSVVLVSYVPVPGTIGEMKTKPTQTAARTLHATGIRADMIVARAPQPLDAPRREKIARFCDVAPEAVVSAPDVATIYDVPAILAQQRVPAILLRHLDLPVRRPTASARAWRAMARTAHALAQRPAQLRIGIIGKYFTTGDYVLADSYISVIEAVRHAATALHLAVEVVWLDAQRYEGRGARTRLAADLRDLAGVIVPGGFGVRGIEGKIAAIRFCREQQIPLLGICYGMQMIVVEFARAVARLRGAHTTEIAPRTPHPVIDLLPEQRAKVAAGDLGGTMRLGAFPACVRAGTVARALYGVGCIRERHRHRYEVNPAYVERLARAGLIFSATSPDGTLMEVAELPPEQHPFFLGAQFHPEFQSRPLRPHPLFRGLLHAAAQRAGVTVRRHRFARPFRHTCDARQCRRAFARSAAKASRRSSRA